MSVKIEPIISREEFPIDWPSRSGTSLHMTVTLENSLRWAVVLDQRGVFLKPILPTHVPKWLENSWYQWTIFLKTPQNKTFSEESPFIVTPKPPDCATPTHIKLPTNTGCCGNNDRIMVTLVCRTHLLIVNTKDHKGLITAQSIYPYMFHAARKTCVLRTVLPRFVRPGKGSTRVIR